MGLVWLDAIFYGVRRILAAGTAKPIRADLNFGSQFVVTDNTVDERTDIALDGDFATEDIETSGDVLVTGSGTVQIGDAVAAAGDLRLDDTGEIAWWTNGAGLTRVTLAKKSAADAVQIGSTTTAQQPATITLGALTSIVANIATADVLTLTSTLATLTTALSVDGYLSMPIAYQAADITLTDADLTTVASDLILSNLAIGKYLLVGGFPLRDANTDGFKFDYALSGGLVVGNAEGVVLSVDLDFTSFDATTTVRRSNLTTDIGVASSDDFYVLEFTAIDVTTGGTLTARFAKFQDVIADTVLKKGAFLLAIGIT